MNCPVEFENKRTVDSWSLVGMGGLVWFLSSVIVVAILKPFFPPKEWEDVKGKRYQEPFLF